MSKVSTICVYCGSSNRAAPAFLDAAWQLGQLIAEDGRAVVYGGGRLGLMGRVADGALSKGGRVIGIIPEHLHAIEVQHDGVTDLRIVDSMHTRKAEMVRESDGFCILPGGIGTLDELIEILSWRQLALHGKPIVIVNQDGFYDPLKALLDHIVEHGFARPSLLAYLTWVQQVEQVLEALDLAEQTGAEVQIDKL